MINILKNLFDLINAVMTFVINLLKGFFNLIQMMPQFTQFVISSFNTLPSIFLPFASASIALATVYFIFNRN